MTRFDYPQLEMLENRQLLSVGPDLTATMLDGVIPASVVPGEGCRLRVNLTNNGDETAISAQLTIRAFFSLDDTIDGSDILLGSATNSLAMSAGSNTTATLTIEVPPGAAPGTYHLILQLDDSVDPIHGPTDNPETNVLNNLVEAPQTRKVSWQFGTFDGRVNVALELPTATAGKSVFFKLTGPGVGVVTGDESGYSIVITNSTKASSVIVLPLAAATLDGVDVQVGSLRSFTAKGVNLTGDFNVDGSLGTLVLGDVGTAGASDIAMTIGSTGDRTTLAATFGRVSNLQLTSDIAIKSLTVVDWRDDFDGADTISAPSLASLKVTGRSGVDGDFAADLVLDGSATASNLGTVKIAGDVVNRDWTISGGLKSLTVTGSVTDSTIRTSGTMSKVTVGAAIGSDFLAGIDPAVARHAAAGADFTNTAALIGSFTVKGWKVASGDPIPRFFDDSNLSAAKINTVKLANMELDNGGTNFGMFVKNIVGAREVKSVTCNDSYSGWTWSWRPKNENPFALQDFVVTII